MSKPFVPWTVRWAFPPQGIICRVYGCNTVAGQDGEGGWVVFPDGLYWCPHCVGKGRHLINISDES